MIRSLVRRLARDEDGIALVMALAIMAVLAITTTGILEAGTANQRTSYVSDQEKSAFAIAQESLAYAEGMVYNAGVNGGSIPTGAQTLPAQADGGTGTYYASTGDGQTWTLVGTGTVDGVTRTVTAHATPPSSTTVQAADVWNYLYADSTTGCETIDGGVTVSVPILTRGDLCLSGGSHFTGSTLAVGGNLTVTWSNVGTKSSPVDEVEVGGSPSSSACTVDNNAATTPGTGACDGTHTDLYASTVGTALDTTPSMPAIDLASTYATQASLPQSGCPAGLLDNDTTLNNSLSASALTTAMFPHTTSYDCKVGSNEIKWTPTGWWSGDLYVNGTLYFDGSLAAGSGENVQFTGQATLYFTGGVTFSGGSQMCGIANCTSSWDPDVDGIIMIAGCWKNSDGSTLIDPKCAYVTGGSHVQLGFYATTNYTVDGGSSNMGPVLSNTFTLNGGSSTLIPFHHFPPGTPLADETLQVPGTPPQDWDG